MASFLAINGISINDVGYGNGLTNTCKFVPDSGGVTANKSVIRNPCEAGTIAYTPVFVDFTISCQLIGDMSGLSTDANDQDEIKVYHNGSAKLTINGVVTAQYDAGTDQTSITATGRKSGVAPSVVAGTSAATAYAS